MTEHKQVSLFNPVYDAMVDVDEGMVEILEILWHQLEIPTLLSCEDNNGKIWIHFDFEDFQDFTSLIFIYNPKFHHHFIIECDLDLVIGDDGFVDEDLDEYITGDMLEYSVGFRFDKDKKDEFINGLKTTFTSSNKPITQNSFLPEHFEINN